MSKTLIGFVTFGLLPFTQQLIKSIRETVTHPYDLFVVVGKPEDWETAEWLTQENIPHKVHTKNMGFPASVNDIYDAAWVEGDYDNLILTGNDVIAYPYCIDSLIELADTSEYLVISALQLDVRSFVDLHPEDQKYFGDDYKVTDFSHACWTKFTDYSPELKIADMQLFDIQNCCLYKREAFDVLGYTDVNFFPAYFIDNDYARRIVLAGIKCCSLVNARFFHFWSRTMKQGTGGSDHRYFENNRRYYIKKWGGNVGQETFTTAFDGISRTLGTGAVLPSENKISDRSQEEPSIEYWKIIH